MVVYFVNLWGYVRIFKICKDICGYVGIGEDIYGYVKIWEDICRYMKIFEDI
jgi:hypothetical protein